MTFKHWNYLRMGTLTILQAFSVVILLAPWLEWVSRWLSFPPLVGYLWVVLTTITAVLLIKLVEGQGNKGYWGLGLGAGFHFGLMFLFNLPPALFGPLLLVLFLIGIRFSFYPKRVQFKCDWAWGTLFFIGTALFQPKLGLHIGLHHVLLYFGLGVFRLILWNAQLLAEDGLEVHHGVLGKVIFGFILGAVVLAGLLSAFLSPHVLQTMVGWVKAAYLGIVDVFVSLIVTPIAWLLGPLFRWAENVEKHPLELEVPQVERIPLEPTVVQEALSPEAVSTAGWIGWLIGVGLLVMVIGLVLRIVLNKREKKTRSTVVEVRESVFSREEVLTDLKQALRGLTKPFRIRKRARFYTGDEPVLQIRSIYTRFVLGMRKVMPYQVSTTPREYQRSVTKEGQVLNHQALEDLTTLYNQARYGESATQEDVRLAQKAVHHMK